jgi:hypothetical protein
LASEDRFGVWDHLRAALLAGLLIIQAADAIPLPELKPRHLANPVAKVELRRWAHILTDLGRPTSPDEVRDFGLRLGGLTTVFRRAVLGPWRPLRTLTGTGQSWGLFAYPEPQAGRLIVEGRREGEPFVPVFRAGELEEGELGPMLRYRRLRGVWDDAGDRPQPRAVYDRLVDLVAQRVFAADPQLVEVEVRIDEVSVILPTEGEDPPETRRHVRNRLRNGAVAQ